MVLTTRGGTRGWLTLKAQPWSPQGQSKLCVLPGHMLFQAAGQAHANSSLRHGIDAALGAQARCGSRTPGCAPRARVRAGLCLAGRNWGPGSRHSNSLGGGARARVCRTRRSRGRGVAARRRCALLGQRRRGAGPYACPGALCAARPVAAQRRQAAGAHPLRTPVAGALLDPASRAGAALHSFRAKAVDGSATLRLCLTHVVTHVVGSWQRTPSCRAAWRRAAAPETSWCDPADARGRGRRRWPPRRGCATSRSSSRARQRRRARPWA